MSGQFAAMVLRSWAMTWREEIIKAGCEADADLVSALELTAAFLRIASRDVGEVRRDHADAILSVERDRVSKAVSEELRVLGDIPTEYLRTALVRAVCVALDGSALRHGILALLAANELDARVGRTFVDACRSRAGSRLRPGDPVPVVRFPSDRMVVAERERVLAALGPRTGDPRNRTAPTDRTDHLRLAPAAVAHIRVRLTWADPWLEPVTAESRFAIGVTNDRDIAADFAWRSYVVGTQPCFYGVSPKDGAEQKRKVSAVLEAAQQNKATSVVLPELCLTKPLLDELREEKRLDEISLFVAGSFHVPQTGDEPGSNVCEVFAFGEPMLRHEKFSDFHYAKDDQRWHEHVSRSDASGFDLLLAPESSAVVLICKDVFGDVGALVKELAPTLLFVPAMSLDTSEFKMLAEGLAHDPQGFTIVSCAGPRLNAIYGRPNRETPVFEGSYEAPTLVVFGPSGVLIEGEPRLN